MRLKRTIKHLTDLGSQIDLPTTNHEFDTLKNSLKSVIDENFDYPTVNTLTYDEYDQVFWLLLSVSGLMTHQWEGERPVKDRIGVRFTYQCKIDPRQDIGQQLQAALDQHEHMKERHNLMQALYYKHFKEDEASESC